MKTFPSFINRYSKKVPPGEVKFFELLKSSKNSDHIISFHSLELPKHVKKRNGEMDFVILFPPLGIIGVEVKSHKNIYVQNGRWYFNDVPKDESPFTQVKDNVISLRKKIESQFPSLKWMLYQRLVVFTDCNLINKPTIEFERWELLQKEDFEKDGFDIIQSLENILKKSYENLKTTSVVKNMGVTELNKLSISLLVNYLRPNYEYYISPRERINDLERDLKNYTREQFKILDTIAEIPHLYVHGSAGTGKTLMAIEAARRKFYNNKNVLFIIYNTEIKEFLRSELHFAKNIGIYSMHEIFKLILGNYEYENLLKQSASIEDFAKESLKVNINIPEEKKYDCLIIDECQDIVSLDNLLILQQFIINDLDKTDILFFGDHKFQKVQNPNALNFENIKQQFLNKLVSIPLSINCRNTENIINDIQIRIQSDIKSSYKEFLRGNSDESNITKYILYDNDEDQCEKLKGIIKDLKKEGYKNKEITVLTRNQHSSNKIFKDDKLENYGLTTEASFRDNFVYLSTYRKFKGLENHVIIVLGIEEITHDFEEFIYISFSRSIHRIISFYQKDFYEKMKQVIRDNLL